MTVWDFSDSGHLQGVFGSRSRTQAGFRGAVDLYKAYESMVMQRRRFRLRESSRKGSHPRTLRLETLERRFLLAADEAIEVRFFHPAPTVLPVFSPQEAVTLTTPWFETAGDLPHDPYPEQNDPGSDGDVSQSPLTNDDTFRLHSRPGSSYTIFLDFDGGITEGTGWNNSTGIETLVDIAYDRNGDPGSFSSSELTEIRNIWKLVAEDFAPFDVNVTTEDPGLDALSKSGVNDTNWGIRSLHTSNTNKVCNSCGGVAYVGSFSSSIDLPAYSFNKGVSAGGNTQSHEVGHAIRLGHDGLSGGTAYYAGHGTGNTTWGPIMGGPGSRVLKTWSNGEYFNASNQEDDLDIITTQNGFSYRPDDHGNTFATATPLQTSAANVVSGFGIIEQNNDVDLFSFWTESGDVSFEIEPYLAHPNLDLWAGIYSDDGILVAESNPSDQVSASFTNLSLAAGKYFLRVDGVGSHGVYNSALDKVFDPGEPEYTGPEVDPPWAKVNPTGYSDYASVGQYWITGTRVTAADSLISIQPVDASRPEGDEGVTPLTFQVVRTGALDSEVQVSYAVLPAVPAADSLLALPTIAATDFASGVIPTGVIRLPAGEATADLVVEIAGDRDFERDEYFRVVLFDPSAGWMVVNSTADGVIESDETSVGIQSVNTAMAVQREGDPGDGATYTFTLERHGDTSQSTTVQWEVQFAGFATAASGADFVGGTIPVGEATFLPGVSEIEISFQVEGDLTVEGDESFAIVVTAASGANVTTVDPASSSRRGIIQEDESPVSLLSEVQFRWRQIRNGTGTRDAWAIDNVALTTTGFADDFEPDLDSLQWASIENGAVNPDDSIFPGTNGQELLMQGSGDRIATSAPLQPQSGAILSFDLIIGNGTGSGGNGADNAEAGKDVWLEYSVDGMHWDVLRKLDTDDFESWKTVSVEVPARAVVLPDVALEGDVGTTFFDFKVVRSGYLDKPATVAWQLVPAGADPIDAMDVDSVGLPSGIVQFATGIDVELISIPIRGDQTLEPDESFDVILTDTTNAGPITVAARLGLVRNDDEPAVESVLVNEGSPQRSSVRRVEVRFDGLVDGSPDAFSLVNLGTDAAPKDETVEDLVITAVDEGGRTKFVLERPGGISLTDGNYRLDIQASLITARFGGYAMAGDFSFGDETVDNFYRKYGDVNGNRLVDLLDFSEFRRSFGLQQEQAGYLAALDWDDDNTIGLLDFGAFRRNFGA